jgi:hypothetical protein
VPIEEEEEFLMNSFFNGSSFVDGRTDMTTLRMRFLKA